MLSLRSTMQTACTGWASRQPSADLLRPCPAHSQQLFRHRSASTRHAAVCAGQGFGGGKQERKGGKKGRGPGGGWYNVAEAAEFDGGRLTKSVIFPSNKQAVVVYRLPNGEVYCSDANSTAFEFPLSNAKILEENGSNPKIQVPLDGTVYELKTGKVVTWCPKDNPIRAVLGSIKSSVPPKNLKMYRAIEEEDGKIWCQV